MIHHAAFISKISFCKKSRNAIPVYSLTMLISLFLKISVAQDNLELRLGSVDSACIFIQDDYYIWCGSAIEDQGKYRMFYSRWPHGKRELSDPLNGIFNGFRGWCKYSEIAYAVSDKLTGPYRHVKTILKGDGDAKKWNRFTMHNPQIRKFGNCFYLYFISNSYDSALFANSTFDRERKHWLQYNATQKIGVLKFKSFDELLRGKFVVSPPLMQPDNIHTFEVATNPTVTEANGKYFMLFKSRKPHVGHMTFWMATSRRPDGPFTLASEVFAQADMACEDPCIWHDKKRKRFYAAVKYYSESKKLVPQFGALALLVSADGLHWEAAAHPLISLREITIKKKKIELTRLERPFVITDKEGQPVALFAAASVKEPTGDSLRVSEGRNTFNVCIPIEK